MYDFDPTHVWTKEEIEYWEKWLINSSHEELAHLWLFAPAGHIVFRRDYDLYQLFQKRFDAMGGMTTDVSKKIGWGK